MKIKRGLETACWKRPVSDAQLESIISEVENDLEMNVESGGSQPQVGEMVMPRLRDLDPVAYVRFASVYRNSKTPAISSMKSSPCWPKRERRGQGRDSLRKAKSSFPSPPIAG